MEHSINVDLINQNGMQGELAPLITANGKIDTNVMRPFVDDDPASKTFGRPFISKYIGGDPSNIKSYVSVPVQKNATLRRDEWKHLDAAVLRVGETRLSGVQDLINRGLTYDLGGNGMGSTVLEYHDMTSALIAELTMDGATRAENDRPEFSTKYLPLPIIHADYQINLRALSASRNMGNALDTTLAERAARAVNLMREQMLFTDTSYAFGGGTIYSYINHPNRATVSMGTDWASDTAANIFADVQAMKNALIAVNKFGPYVLYIPNTYEGEMDADYSASGTSVLTLRDRIKMINMVDDVVTVDTMPTGNAVLVDMNADTVRLVRGMGMQNIEWATEGGLIGKYKVMTIEVPQIRADSSSQCGVCHCS